MIHKHLCILLPIDLLIDFGWSSKISWGCDQIDLFRSRAHNKKESCINALPATQRTKAVNHSLWHLISVRPVDCVVDNITDKNDVRNQHRGDWGSRGCSWPWCQLETAAVFSRPANISFHNIDRCTAKMTGPCAVYFKIHKTKQQKNRLLFICFIFLCIPFRREVEVWSWSLFAHVGQVDTSQDSSCAMFCGLVVCSSAPALCPSFFSGLLGTCCEYFSTWLCWSPDLWPLTSWRLLTENWSSFPSPRNLIDIWLKGLDICWRAH